MYYVGKEILLGDVLHVLVLIVHADFILME